MELFGYQKEISLMSKEILNVSGGVALLMDMGTGKTVTAADISRIAKRVLIVCPTTVASVWANGDINKLIPDAVVTDMTLIQRSKRKGKGNYCIINYNSVWIKDGKKAVPDKWILDWQPDMIICDEAHALAEPTSAQSMCMHQLADITKYRLGLTGTPINNSPLDAWSIMRFIDKHVFDMPFIAFKNKYTIMTRLKKGSRTFGKVVGFKNLEELKSKLHSVSFRVTREEVFDLPKETETMVAVEMVKEDRAIYDDIVNSTRQLVDIGDRDNALTMLLRLRQFLGGFVPVIDKDGIEQIRYGNTAKIKTLLKLAKHLNAQGKPFIVFCQFTNEVEIMYQFLTESGIKAKLLYGRIKKNERELLISDFQSGVYDVLVCQTKIASSGLTLTRGVASVFYSFSFSIQEMLQAKARIYRKGQEKPVTHYYLVTRCSVEEYVMSRLRAKKSVSSKLTEIKGMLK